MTDAVADETGKEGGKGPGKLWLILSVFLALAGGGGGFYAVQSGLLASGAANIGQEHDENAGSDTGHALRASDQHASDNGADHGNGPEDLGVTSGGLAYVEIPPVNISLRDSTVADILRFRMQLEVAASHKGEVAHLQPRIMDLLNGYLRALAPADFEDPMILLRLRSQILRRVQMVAGPGKINDVLIMEFVLN